jgi:hypothetical protein
MFDVEADFLNADLDNPKSIQELRFSSEEYEKAKCIELTKVVYGYIDSPLRWMKTFSKHQTPNGTVEANSEQD